MVFGKPHQWVALLFEALRLTAAEKYKESQEAEGGEFQQWDLPWLRLVFDQRFDHTISGEGAPGPRPRATCRCGPSARAAPGWCWARATRT